MATLRERLKTAQKDTRPLSGGVYPFGQTSGTGVGKTNGSAAWSGRETVRERLAAAKQDTRPMTGDLGGTGERSGSFGGGLTSGGTAPSLGSGTGTAIPQNRLTQAQRIERDLENDYHFLQGFEQDWTGEKLYEEENWAAQTGKDLEKVKSDTRLQRGTSAGFGGTGGAGGSFGGGRTEGGAIRASASEEPLGAMDTGQIQLELDAAQKRQQQAQRQYNLYIDDGAGSAYASLSPETRKALTDELNAANEEVKTLTRQLEQAAYLNRYQNVVYAEDSFWNQAKANYQLGRIGQDANAAFSAYLADPTEANLNYANALQGLEGQFQRNNQLVLDDEGAELPWLSKTAAGYLPQFIDRTKAQIGWGTVGAVGGAAVGNPVLGAKAGITAASGLQTVTQMEGAAYRALISAGVDEETARQAARDEALISSLIEMGDTAFDIVTLGGNKALAAIGKAALKSGSKNYAVKELGKFALNVAGEGLGEGVQQGVSIANRRRTESGIGDLISRTMDTLGDALSGRDEEARNEILDAGREGLKIALMFGGPVGTVNTAVSLKQAWDEVNRTVETSAGEGYNSNSNSNGTDQETNQGEGRETLGPGVYTDIIKWRKLDIKARPEGKGFWGERVKQGDERVDRYELQINPNDESYYLPHPNGSYVQFENLIRDTVQDGKLVMKTPSFFHVYDLPGFAKNKVLTQARRQLEAANMADYTVEWLVSEERAVEQLRRLFKEQNMDITVTYYPEEE